MRGRCLALVLVAAALATAGVVAQEADDGLDADDWPCPQKYRPTLAASSVWNGPDLGDAAVRWRDAAAIRKLAELLASPETSPDRGLREIERFAATLTGERTAALTRLFAGVLEEINGYRRFAADGVWEFTAKRRLMARVLAKTEAAHAAVPYDGSADSAAERKRLEEERFWQLRAYDDFEDEARYLCKRLVYLEGKLGRLARAIIGHLER